MMVSFKRSLDVSRESCPRIQYIPSDNERKAHPRLNVTQLLGLKGHVSQEVGARFTPSRVMEGYWASNEPIRFLEGPSAQSTTYDHGTRIYDSRTVCSRYPRM